MAEIRSAFGTAVRLARTRRRWTQEELAQASGVKRSYLSGIERGERNPSLEIQEKIATALGLTLGELMTATDEERERARQRHQARRRGGPESASPSQPR